VIATRASMDTLAPAVPAPRGSSERRGQSGTAVLRCSTRRVVCATTSSTPCGSDPLCLRSGEAVSSDPRVACRESRSPVATRLIGGAGGWRVGSSDYRLACKIHAGRPFVLVLRMRINLTRYVPVASSNMLASAPLRVGCTAVVSDSTEHEGGNGMVTRMNRGFG
jgi:hypothetical protein